MSEQSKATPGPWSVGCPNGKRHDIMKSGYVVVAELPHVQGDSAMVIEAYKEREANAALIAACPDLLQALQEMVKIWEGPRERAAVGFAAAVVQARAAISKAKGTA